MRKGDLVRVRWGGHHHRMPADSALGEVLDYRPDVLGGSSSQSYWDGERWVNEFTSSPKRGQVLVLIYEDGGMAWWDESNVEEVEDGS